MALPCCMQAGFANGEEALPDWDPTTEPCTWAGVNCSRPGVVTDLCVGWAGRIGQGV